MASSSSSLPPDVICRLDFFLTRLVVHSRIHNLQEILEIKLLVAISVMLEHLAIELRSQLAGERRITPPLSSLSWLPSRIDGTRLCLQVRKHERATSTSTP
uniref:Uncharacterized protein n=1 Tax=Guillardia theta TaxID=55529 RepID=A0A7S4P4N6_GUITH